MPLPSGLSENYLLAAVPAAELARLASELEPVPLALGQMLYGPGGQLQHAYFPTTSIVSLHYVTESGASAEVAGVGDERDWGGFPLIGGNNTPNSAVVQ